MAKIRSSGAETSDDKPKKKSKKTSLEEFAEELEAAMKKSSPFGGTLISTAVHPTIPYATYQYVPTPNVREIKLNAEDLEMCDVDAVTRALEDLMNTLYPPFEPEIVHTMDKEYFLPALKVLVYRDGRYMSPQKEVVWKDMELGAECVHSPWSFGAPRMIGNDIAGFGELESHAAPDESCDCGIYGSVNLEEVQAYLNEDAMSQSTQWVASYTSYADEVSIPISRRKLCIIEPNPGAKVIICRKGWKASGAFISEIIDETISVSEASNLLSIAWHREIDMRKLNENR